MNVFGLAKDLREKKQMPHEKMRQLNNDIYLVGNSYWSITAMR